MSDGFSPGMAESCPCGECEDSKPPYGIEPRIFDESPDEAFDRMIPPVPNPYQAEND